MKKLRLILKILLGNELNFAGGFTFNRTRDTGVIERNIENEDKLLISNSKKKKYDFTLHLGKKEKELFKSIFSDETKIKLKLHETSFWSSNNVSNSFSLYANSKEIARFSISQLTGCCGVAVLNDVCVDAFLRRKGIGNVVHKLAEVIAKSLDYGKIMCTTTMKNEAEQSLLYSRNWLLTDTFVNPKTSNTVLTYIKEL